MRCPPPSPRRGRKTSRSTLVGSPWRGAARIWLSGVDIYNQCNGGFHLRATCALAPRQGGISMPIFEYVCKDCSRAFEAIVQGAMKAKCPACHSVRLDKKLSVFAVAGSPQTETGAEQGARGGGRDPR